jgi:hypothetical protein
LQNSQIAERDLQKIPLLFALLAFDPHFLETYHEDVIFRKFVVNRNLNATVATATARMPAVL